MEQQPEKRTINQKLTELERLTSQLQDQVDHMQVDILVLKDENNALNDVIQSLVNELNKTP